jgi:hypothetical protein
MKIEVKEIRKNGKENRKISRERSLFNWLLLPKGFNESLHFCNKKLLKIFENKYAGGLYFLCRICCKRFLSHIILFSCHKQYSHKDRSHYLLVWSTNFKSSYIPKSSGSFPNEMIWLIRRQPQLKIYSFQVT